MRFGNVMMVGLGLLAFGCADSEGDPKSVVEPEFGKTDSLRSVQQEGTLVYGEPLENSFDEDATFHGYKFTSLSTGKVTAEVTQRGTSRGLDTTMFLFGARSNDNWERIAFDDDDGWGPLSKIDDIVVGEYGTYMVVVGTANGLGRGAYRLELTCENDACLDTSPVELTDCNGELYDILDECVNEQLSEADWGWDDPAEEWSIEYCAYDGLQEYLDWSCPAGNANNPDVCRATTAQLNAVAPICEERLKDEYHVFDTVNLGSMSLDGPLGDLAEQLEADGDSLAYTELRGYSVPNGASPEEVAASIRQDWGRVSALHIGSSAPRDEYRERSYLPVEVIDAIEAERGVDYVGINVSGSYYVAAGAEEWVDIEVLHYPDDQAAFAIISVAGED